MPLILEAFRKWWEDHGLVCTQKIGHLTSYKFQANHPTSFDMSFISAEFISYTTEWIGIAQGEYFGGQGIPVRVVVSSSFEDPNPVGFECDLYLALRGPVDGFIHSLQVDTPPPRQVMFANKSYVMGTETPQVTGKVRIHNVHALTRKE